MRASLAIREDDPFDATGKNQLLLLPARCQQPPTLLTIDISEIVNIDIVNYSMLFTRRCFEQRATKTDNLILTLFYEINIRKVI